MEQQHDEHQHEPVSLTRSAVQATVHCLTGCAIGEVLGMVLATALGWGNAASIAISIVLAFFFGYALTLRYPPVQASGDIPAYWPRSASRRRARMRACVKSQ